jgi:cytochrome c oxidase assembly protein subunit 15
MEEFLTFPHHTPVVTARATHENATAVRNWLFLIAALVLLMVLVGGATRLTESGLSITQWKPVTGVIPPLSHKDWLEAFEDYKKIPQYKELFPDMDLARFQVIYGWEWAHRLLGRLIGLVFVVGYAYFLLKKRIPPGLTPKLLAILALGAAQGAVGWWMVASGLSGRVEVAQERLAIHLLMAALIFSFCLWVASGLGRRGGSHIERGASRLRFTAMLILGLVFVQLGAGALVAGLRAGLVDNTWPLMEGSFIPSASALWNLSPWWSNFLDNPVTAQFTHRMTAYVIFALAFAHVADAAVNTSGRVRRGAFLLFGHVFLQLALGIATLVLIEGDWTGTPHILLALAHQAVAFAVLAFATLQTRRLVYSYTNAANKG